MGKKRITSAQEFHEKILDFIEFSELHGVSPTDHALWNYLGLRPSEFEALSKGRNKDGSAWNHLGDSEQRKVAEERDKRDADDAIKKLVAYREDRLVRELEKSRTTSSNVIFQLKQSKNGGYQDIQTAEGSATITVKVEGVGGLDAFK